jgi:phage shock protein A
MRADVFLDLMAMLDDCTAEESAKAEFRKMIRDVATANCVDSLERTARRAERVGYARHLLKDLGEARPVTRERLIDRFQVSRAQAYADMSDALQSVQKVARPLDEWSK